MEKPDKTRWMIPGLAWRYLHEKVPVQDPDTMEEDPTRWFPVQRLLWDSLGQGFRPPTARNRYTGRTKTTYRVWTNPSSTIAPAVVMRMDQKGNISSRKHGVTVQYQELVPPPGRETTKKMNNDDEPGQGSCTLAKHSRAQDILVLRHYVPRKEDSPRLHAI
ncbi:hypothetical protein BO78DRAFT_389598 [Aspergillus sclerotiicarbonarius CBS 121057]|uniref:Uncharacterized protein n=1 Tax=Aspergillus sclerotiicarbonarius (strain CBS 121057 / IBT 28362) TaxID=1448318 RepID=A0A319DZL1_ASPSB|nr:hypothetical protein BO78DRAFT_389598 [Aspergillus sclerotiicarbonarius CBS 121057]